jgi:hypothetical protein
MQTEKAQADIMELKELAKSGGDVHQTASFFLIKTVRKNYKLAKLPGSKKWDAVRFWRLWPEKIEAWMRLNQ